MSDQVPKLLKLTVISVGLMLVGGFVWVGAVIAQRAGEEAARPAPSHASQCPEITLPKLAGATATYVEGEWIITTRNEVRRYSECGELLQKATLTRD